MEGVIELTDNVPGQGDLPDHAALAAFQRHDVYNAAFDVDCCRCDGEDFGNPAASQTQDDTKKLHLKGTRRRLDETPTLSGVEILTAAG